MKTNKLDEIFADLKDILGDERIGEDRFFERVSLMDTWPEGKENQIDVRLLLRIILMFNQDLYPVRESGLMYPGSMPVDVCTRPDEVLELWLKPNEGGTKEQRVTLRRMAPIIADVLRLWDIIERELPLVRKWRYKRLPFAHSEGNTRTLFSNCPLELAVPQSILFSFTSAFIVLVEVDAGGNYHWMFDPFEAWSEVKKEMLSELIRMLKENHMKLDSFIFSDDFWRYLSQRVFLHRFGLELGGQDVKTDIVLFDW